MTIPHFLDIFETIQLKSLKLLKIPEFPVNLELNNLDYVEIVELGFKPKANFIKELLKLKSLQVVKIQKEECGNLKCLEKLIEEGIDVEINGKMIK